MRRQLVDGCVAVTFMAAALMSGVSCDQSMAPDATVSVRSALDSNVVVTVRDGAGVLQPDMYVMVERNGNVIFTEWTTSSGQVTFTLPAGSYRFIAAEADAEFVSGAAGHCVTPSCATASITVTRVDVTVVDASGAPQPGRELWWEQPGGGADGYAETGANGHALAPVPPGSYRFVLNVNGTEFASGAAGHCTIPGCTAATITLPVPVAVTVRNANNVPQPNLTVGWENAQGGQDGWTDTDANGVAMLLPPVGTYRFVVYVADNEFASGPANHCVVPGCTSASITVPAPVLVTVVDTAGTPISGKAVLWEDASLDAGGNTNTNASGQASITPPLEPVRFRVAVDGTTFYSSATYTCTQPGCTSATILVSQPTVVTVVNGSGTPISGKAVTLLTVQDVASGNKTTNASGQVTFRMPFGQWRFRAPCGANSEVFYSGDAGHCFNQANGCLTAKITMPCGQCTNQPNGQTCNDGNPCTGASNCSSQRCVGSSPMSCSASDQCHVAGACSAETATCSNPTKANGTSCSDGNSCTQSDTCQAGACTSGNPVVCTASDQCHVAGTCNPATGVCSTPNANNGTSCSDGNLCTQTDSCQAGACVGANPVTCGAQDQCNTAGTCNPASGTCSGTVRVADGSACSDGNRCSVGDSCQAGTCLPGPATGCSAGQPQYLSVIDLGSAQFASYATGINNSGVVVGTETPNGSIYQLGYPGSKGFYWSESQGKRYLPWTGAQSYAVDINAAGVMSVTAGVDPWLLQPCRYDPAVDAQPVCNPNAGNASGINAAGILTGSSYYPHGAVRMFRLGTGPIEILPSFLGLDPQAKGVAIADDGSVVGNQVAANWQGVRYTAARGTERLVDLLPPGSTWSSANPSSIKPGEILGWGVRDDGHGRAFRIRTTPNGDVADIVALPVPSTYSSNAPNITIASKSNASGEIVGSVYDALPYWPQAAFVYTEATDSIDLNTLIDPLSGWTLQAAFSINDNHEVVGYGTHDGSSRAYKLKLPNLTPCPPPADPCRLPGTRDVQTGVCTYPAKPDGTTCNDGASCTQSETCRAGSCQDTSPFPTVLNLPVTDMGSLGVIQSTAVDINDLGTVVGWSSLSDVPNISDTIHGWRYEGSGPLADLNGLAALGTPSIPTAINDAGTIVGYHNTANGMRAFRYNPTSGLENLDTDGDTSVAVGINNAGQLAVYTATGQTIEGFRFTEGVGYEEVGSLGGGTMLWNISESGRVVGSSWTQGGSSSTGRAVMFDNEVVGLRDLNDFVDPLSGWTLVKATSASGDFVVGDGIRDGKATAFRLHLSPDGAVVEEITGGWEGGMYSGKFTITSATSVNAAGDMVGYGMTGANQPWRAFAYTDRLGFKSLNDLISPTSNWHLLYSTSINAFGDIIGAGYHTGFYGPHPFRLRLPPGEAATCQARAVCGGPAVCLFSDGVVEMPNGTFVAVFGYDSSSTSSVTPTQNEVPASQPPPPASFEPGIHAGAYQPPFTSGETVSWTVNGQTVTASASSPRLPTVPIAGPSCGLGVSIGGAVVTIVPCTPPPDLSDTIVTSDTSYTSTDAIRDAAHGPNSPQYVGPTSSGTLGGEFRVTNDGAGEYVINISTPPGRNGVEPHLALNYNSRSGSGVLGPGWSLSGLHRIARCKTSYATARERSQDPSAVTYTDADSFCFDGEHMVAVGTGRYRTKRDIGSNFQVLSSDARGPVSFKVFRKDGLIEYYGLDASSRGERERITSVNGSIPGQATVTTTIVRREWFLSKVVDRFGNAMAVSYRFDPIDFNGVSIGGPGVPDTIQYTSNEVTGRPATKTIEFSYVSTPENRAIGLDSGVPISSGAKLLTAITIKGPNPIESSTIATYKFVYDKPSITNRSLLRRVQRCDGQGICMAPTMFSWEAGSYAFNHIVSQVDDFHLGTQTYERTVETRAARSRVLVAADFNGDGREDILYRTPLPPVTFEASTTVLRNSSLLVRFGQSGGFGSAMESGIPTILGALEDDFEPYTGNIYAKPIPVDMNGDGRADIVLPQSLDILPRVAQLYDIFERSPSAGSVFRRLPPGLTSTQYLDPTLNPEAVARSNHLSVFLPADLDGDGRVDVTRSYGNTSFGVRFNSNGSLGNYLVLNGSTGAPIPWLVANQAQEYSMGGVFAADVDGDGRTEVIMGDSNDNAIGVHFGTVTPNTMPLNLKGIPRIGAGAQIKTLDINGDHLPDVLVGNRLWGNLGGRFLPLANLPQEVVDDGTVIDMNGDGFDDFLVVGCSLPPRVGPLARVYLSEGDGGFTIRNLDLPPGLGLHTHPSDPEPKACPRVLMDVDGDGMKDLVQPQEGSDNLHIYFRTGKRPDRLTGIRNGLGATTSIEYGQSGGSTIGCQYPHLCGNPQAEVVLGYTVDEGRVAVGELTHFSMLYTGAKADAMGGGWLGFTNVQKTNDRTHVVERKTFDLTTQIGNWYPFVGLPKFAITTYRLGTTGRTIHRQRRTLYNPIPANPLDLVGPYSVQIDSIDEREIEVTPDQGFDENNAQRWTVQDYTYDEFANVRTHETRNMVTGTVDRVEYSISNDANNWLIGKVHGITATSTSSTGETDQRSTTFDIDGATGAVNSKTIQPGDPMSQLAIVYTRTAEGLVRVVTATPVTGPSRVSTIDYDAIEGAWPVAYINALGHTTAVLYHRGLGVLATSTDPNGAITRWQYDGFGRERAAFHPTGMSSSTHISRPNSSIGLIVSWTDSTGGAGSVTTDSLGREVTRKETGFGADRNVSSTRVYDATSGMPQFVSRPFGVKTGAPDPNPAAGVSLAYDELGRVISVTPPGEATRTFVYDRLRTTELVAGIEKGYQVEDGSGHRVLAVAIEPTSPAPDHEIRTTFDYGAFGSLRHVYQPNGSTITLSYDHLGRRTQISDPDAGNRGTIFNAFGEIETEQLPGQEDVAYGRDLLGRATTVTSGDGVSKFLWDTAPHGIGKLDSESSPFGVAASYRYLPNGLPATSTWYAANAAFIFNRTYDGSGRPRTITYPTIGGGNRFGVTLGYGGDGQIASVSSSATGSLFWGKTDVADDGELYTEHFGDGLLGLRQRDPISGRILHIATGSGSIIPEVGGGQTFQNAVQSLGYQYYPDGKVQGRSDILLGATESFTYDNLDRLSTWSVSSLGSLVTYGYDDIGNLKTRQDARPGGTTLESYVYGENGAGPHALTSGPAGSYAYDVSGRQTARPGQPSLTYTAFDLPKQILKSDGTSVTFGYNASGERIRKVTATSDVLTLEGGLYERRIEGGVTTHVLYLRAGNKAIGQVSCDATGFCGEPVYYHHDRLGTPDTVTSGGTLLGRQKRDPFGRIYSPANFSDPSPTVSLGFIGQTEDREVGLIDLKHRLYDANIGRFISPDPLVKDPFNGQDYNRYSYARNNPLTFIDPSGLQALEVDPTAPPGSITAIERPTVEGMAALRAQLESHGWTVSFSADGSTITVVRPNGRVDVGPYNPLDVWVIPQRRDAENPDSRKDFAISRNASPAGVADDGAGTSPGAQQGFGYDGPGSRFAAHNAWLLGGNTPSEFQTLANHVDYAKGGMNGARAELGEYQTEHIADASVFIAQLPLMLLGGGSTTLATRGAGQLRRVGDLLETAHDVLANPSLLRGQTMESARMVFGKTPGWVDDVMRHSTTNPGGGWVFREMNAAGREFTGRLIQYHPGTPRHFGGLPYWKVSGVPGLGPVRIPLGL